MVLTGYQPRHPDLTPEAKAAARLKSPEQQDVIIVGDDDDDNDFEELILSFSLTIRTVTYVWGLAAVAAEIIIINDRKTTHFSSYLWLSFVSMVVGLLANALAPFLSGPTPDLQLLHVITSCCAYAIAYALFLSDILIGGIWLGSLLVAFVVLTIVRHPSKFWHCIVILLPTGTLWNPGPYHGMMPLLLLQSWSLPFLIIALLRIFAEGNVWQLHSLVLAAVFYFTMLSKLAHPCPVLDLPRPTLCCRQLFACASVGHHGHQ